MKKAVLISTAILLAVLTVVFAQERGVKKKRPLPQDYGKVVLNNFSEKNRMAPVAFDHWLHRSKFTCRLCHSDIGFEMKAGATEIKADDNINGFYCGTCHNGKRIFDGKFLFPACDKGKRDEVCDRCHSSGKDVKRENNFSELTAKLPKERFGNGIDWEKAEKDNLIKLIDFIDGVSISRKKEMPVQKDFSLEPKVSGLPEIVFSHQKHTVWNGCEVCHPDIFTGVKKGATKYSMIEIFDGKFCGVCHGKVAFPTMDCQRCHVKPVS
ncbi:MAG: hypothetical protein C4526_00740 [Nitrospiraceae bacterium]|nr:MAG: hypothetical protein C4526_00740 [Nitrospiraceae bacterium]